MWTKDPNYVFLFCFIIHAHVHYSHTTLILLVAVEVQDHLLVYTNTTMVHVWSRCWSLWESRITAQSIPVRIFQLRYILKKSAWERPPWWEITEHYWQPVTDKHAELSLTFLFFFFLLHFFLHHFFDKQFLITSVLLIEAVTLIHFFLLTCEKEIIECSNFTHTDSPYLAKVHGIPYPEQLSPAHLTVVQLTWSAPFPKELSNMFLCSIYRSEMKLHVIPYKSSLNHRA